MDANLPIRRRKQAPPTTSSLENARSAAEFHSSVLAHRNQMKQQQVNDSNLSLVSCGENNSDHALMCTERGCEACIDCTYVNMAHMFNMEHASPECTRVFSDGSVCGFVRGLDLSDTPILTCAYGMVTNRTGEEQDEASRLDGIVQTRVQRTTNTGEIRSIKTQEIDRAQACIERGDQKNEDRKRKATIRETIEQEQLERKRKLESVRRSDHHRNRYMEQVERCMTEVWQLDEQETDTNHTIWEDSEATMRTDLLELLFTGVVHAPRIAAYWIMDRVIGTTYADRLTRSEKSQMQSLQTAWTNRRGSGDSKKNDTHTAMEIDNDGEDKENSPPPPAAAAASSQPFRTKYKQDAQHPIAPILILTDEQRHHLRLEMRTILLRLGECPSRQQSVLTHPHTDIFMDALFPAQSRAIIQAGAIIYCLAGSAGPDVIRSQSWVMISDATFEVLRDDNCTPSRLAQLHEHNARPDPLLSAEWQDYSKFIDKALEITYPDEWTAFTAAERTLVKCEPLGELTPVAIQMRQLYYTMDTKLKRLYGRDGIPYTVAHWRALLTQSQTTTNETKKMTDDNDKPRKRGSRAFVIRSHKTIERPIDPLANGPSKFAFWLLKNGALGENCRSIWPTMREIRTIYPASMRKLFRQTVQCIKDSVASDPVMKAKMLPMQQAVHEFTTADDTKHYWQHIEQLARGFLELGLKNILEHETTAIRSEIRKRLEAQLKQSFPKTGSNVLGHSHEVIAVSLVADSMANFRIPLLTKKFFTPTALIALGAPVTAPPVSECRSKMIATRLSA